MPRRELALDGGDRRGGAVAGHRAGVAEAEVDVVVPVDAGDVRAGGALDEGWERAGPLDHPVHRDAVEERRLRPLEQLAGPRMGPGEAVQLGRHETVEAGAVDGGGIRGPKVTPSRIGQPRGGSRADPVGATGSVHAAGVAADGARRDPACRGRRRDSWCSRWCCSTAGRPLQTVGADAASRRIDPPPMRTWCETSCPGSVPFGHASRGRRLAAMALVAAQRPDDSAL